MISFIKWFIILCDITGLQQQKQWNSSFIAGESQLSSDNLHLVLHFTCLATKPVGIYMFKVSNRMTRTNCGICSNLTIKTPELRQTPERHQWRRIDVFIVNFEHIWHFVLVFLLLTLSMQVSAGRSFRIIDASDKTYFQITSSCLTVCWRKVDGILYPSSTTI